MTEMRSNFDRTLAEAVASDPVVAAELRSRAPVTRADAEALYDACRDAIADPLAPRLLAGRRVGRLDGVVNA
jgi:hypothetical protein